MGALDKYSLMEKLIEAGWTHAPGTCDSKAGYCLVPPDSLWQNKPLSFYVYYARDLQELLDPEWKEWEDDE